MHLDRSEKIALVLIILAILVGTVIRISRKNDNASASRQIAAEVGPYKAEADKPKRPPDKYIVVHVGGEVVKPGVYRLREGSRIIDAVLAAGGGTTKADLDSLNLAQTIYDGEKIEVTEPGADTREVEGSDTGQPGGGAKVNLNSSSVEQLDTLPGIGPALAKRIVDDRKAHGPYKSLDDLDRVSGIGKGLISKLDGLAAAN